MRIICVGSWDASNVRKCSDGTRWDRVHVSRFQTVTNVLKTMNVGIKEAVKVSEITGLVEDELRPSWVEDESSEYVAIRHTGSCKMFHVACEMAKKEQNVPVTVHTWDFGSFYNKVEAKISLPKGVSKEAFYDIVEQLNKLTDDFCGARVCIH